MVQFLAVYLVFSQDQRLLPDWERLAAHAEKFFGAKVELVERTATRAKLKLTSSRPPFASELTIDGRAVTRDDLSYARDAEVRGRAAGMGALAERCKVVWELRDSGSVDAHPAAILTLCAACASVALGPILPPDHSTLFGVRGAIERRDRASG
jgi:hypothetical protein